MELNPDYELGFVARVQTARKSVTLESESAAADTVRSKSEAQRLILSAAADESAVDFLMHISG